jgi:hypothetical protein
MMQDDETTAETFAEAKNIYNFVLCPSFHGATVFSRVLTSHRNIVSLGDSLPIKAFRDGVCSCGKGYLECDFWRHIEAEFDSPRYAPEPYLLPILPRFTFHPLANALLYRAFLATARALGPWAWKAAGAPARRFREDYIRFAQIACRLQGKRTYVDGVKAVRRFEVLRSMTPGDVAFRILHLIRSPMGFLHSCRKHEEAADLRSCAALWRKVHGGILQQCRGRKHQCEYLQIRYEDFCRNPQDVMNRVVRFLDESPQEFTPEVLQNATHHILGNVSSRHFDGSIELSESWRETLSRDEQEQMIELTRPLSNQFGYDELD